MPRSFQIVEHREDAIGVRVLVVQPVERACEPHRVARVVTLVKLLAAGKRRDRGVERQAEQFDARCGVGVGRLEIG